MIDLNQHFLRCGPYAPECADIDPKNNESLHKHIEPWLTAVFQCEHLSLLLGSGFISGVALACGGKPTDMSRCQWECHEGQCEWTKCLIGNIEKYADRCAQVCGRGTANIEDQIRVALQLQAGLEVMGDNRSVIWKQEIDKRLRAFMEAILQSERTIRDASGEKREQSEDLLVSFLLSFASRSPTRERLTLFTTNYDRLIEYGCDLAGLHVIDRFVGALCPIFRATRLNVDIHYSPPGIRGEPRYLEGVIRLCKLHGSLDWHWAEKELRRLPLPFGAPANHPDIPREPSKSVMIYPNSAKDVETLDYPYAELFRDFAAAVCRPNSSLVTYGYGFGDDHVNRVIKDMLTIPSTHLVIIAWDETKPQEPDAPANTSRKRIIRFCRDAGQSDQISLLLGSHFGDLRTLVMNYLPKPAIDPITIRKKKLEEERGDAHGEPMEGDANEQTD